MSAVVIDPATIAASYREALRSELAALPERLTLRGLLAPGHAPSATYAEYTRRGCQEVGIDFDLRVVEPAQAEAAVREAGSDKSVHGILVYYPILGTPGDAWLRELVDPRKDIEGLHSFWARCLYENRRYIDGAHEKRAILPSTPLAVLKLLAATGAFDPENDEPLANLRAVIFNRSEVVGLPLAAMMANDGAEVVSFDIEGPKLFVKTDGAQRVRSIEISRAEALERADVVITGVPSRSFPLVRASEIKAGAICLNFSTYRNFGDDVLERASYFVPRVGPMTVTMALRNTIRLYQHKL